MDDAKAVELGSLDLHTPQYSSFLLALSKAVTHLVTDLLALVIPGVAQGLFLALFLRDV